MANIAIALLIIIGAAAPIVITDSSGTNRDGAWISESSSNYWPFAFVESSIGFSPFLRVQAYRLRGEVVSEIAYVNREGQFRVCSPEKTLNVGHQDVANQVGYSVDASICSGRLVLAGQDFWNKVQN